MEPATSGYSEPLPVVGIEIAGDAADDGIELTAGPVHASAATRRV